MAKKILASLLFASVCGLSACSSTESVTSNTAAETSVRPSVNTSYKDPDLDVEMWAERFSGESREVFAQRLNILAALDLKQGDRIADIGAGTGLYVKLFVESVGSGGKVFAVDISKPFLDFIATKAKEDNLANVETVLGEDRSSNLPDESVDIVFHSDVYHHFEFPKTMVRDLARVLRANGQMYVLDFERIEGVTQPRLLDHVRAGKGEVIAEIEASGFSLVEEIDLPGLVDNYLLRFQKNQ